MVEKCIFDSWTLNRRTIVLKDKTMGRTEGIWYTNQTNPADKRVQYRDNM